MSQCWLIFIDGFTNVSRLSTYTKINCKHKLSGESNEIHCLNDSFQFQDTLMLSSSLATLPTFKLLCPPPKKKNSPSYLLSIMTESHTVQWKIARWWLSEHEKPVQCTVWSFITGRAVISCRLNSSTDWLEVGPNELQCLSSVEGPHIVCGFKFEFQMVTKLKRGRE